MDVRTLLLAVLLPVSTAAADELRGELLVTSNYVWRGISLSEDAPAVLGGFDYLHERGAYGVLQVANVQVEGNPEQQLILTAGYARPVGEWGLNLGVVQYEYVRGDRYDPATGRLAPGTANNADFLELFLGISHGNGEFHYHRSEDYLGRGELSNYYELNYAAPLRGDASWLIHYGYTDSRAILDHASQLSDIAFGVVKGPFSFIITNLDDNEDGLQSRNPRFVLSWHQTIDF